MKTLYRIYADMNTLLYLDVEAESEEQALAIANETDGGDFIEIDPYLTGTLEITGAIEIETI